MLCNFLIWAIFEFENPLPPLSVCLLARYFLFGATLGRKKLQSFREKIDPEFRCVEKSALIFPGFRVGEDKLSCKLIEF